MPPNRLLSEQARQLNDVAIQSLGGELKVVSQIARRHIGPAGEKSIPERGQF